MVIFHSYVSLPEGKSFFKIQTGDKNSLKMIFLLGVPDIHWDDPRRKLLVSNMSHL
jgi:hypothetical protein